MKRAVRPLARLRERVGVRVSCEFENLASASAMSFIHRALVLALLIADLVGGIPKGRQSARRRQVALMHLARLYAYNAFTRAFFALAMVSLLRSGNPNTSAAISNTSPFWVLIPSEKDSVAVPKK
jgi:drug/metabolite transporter (DMT)-like permease